MGTNPDTDPTHGGGGRVQSDKTEPDPKYDRVDLDTNLVN